MVLGFHISNTLSYIIGFVYPVINKNFPSIIFFFKTQQNNKTYQSFKALETPETDDDVQLLTYCINKTFFFFFYKIFLFIQMLKLTHT